MRGKLSRVVAFLATHKTLAFLAALAAAVLAASAIGKVLSDPVFVEGGPL